MKTRELKIHIPEGQEIDWQESAKQEKIIFKPIDTKPRSWEEYCKNRSRDGQYYIHSDSVVMQPENIYFTAMIANQDMNLLPTKELAKAFLAMMQLMSLRQAWISNWKPDWNDVNQNKVYIICGDGEFIISHISKSISRPLSFPTEEMAEDFMNCFKDLLKIAKPLI